MKLGFLDNEKYRREAGRKVQRKIDRYIVSMLKEMSDKDSLILLSNDYGKSIAKHAAKKGKKTILVKYENLIHNSDIISLFWDKLYWDRENDIKAENKIIKLQRMGKEVINLMEGKPEVTEKIETLSDIFNVTGTEKDSDPYTHPITDMERMIYESADFEYSNGQVLETHENLSGGRPYYYRINFIQQKLGRKNNNKIADIPAKDAQRLSELFENLDLSEKVSLNFLNRIKENDSLVIAIDYLQKYEFKEKEKDEVEKEAIKEPEREISIDTLRDECEKRGHKLDMVLKYASAKGIDIHREKEVNNQHNQDLKIKNGQDEEKILGNSGNFISKFDKENMDGFNIVDGKEINSVYEEGFSPYGFHVVNQDAPIPKGMNQTAYERGKNSINLSVKMLIEKINESKTSADLAKFGVNLYKIQSGKIKLKDLPNKDEWSYLWQTFKVKKFMMNREKETNPLDRAKEFEIKKILNSPRFKDTEKQNTENGFSQSNKLPGEKSFIIGESKEEMVYLQGIYNPDKVNFGWIGGPWEEKTGDSINETLNSLDNEVVAVLAFGKDEKGGKNTNKTIDILKNSSKNNIKIITPPSDYKSWKEQFYAGDKTRFNIFSIDQYKQKFTGEVKRDAIGSKILEVEKELER